MSTDREPHSNQPVGATDLSDEEAAGLWAEFIQGANPRGLAAFERLYNQFLPVVFRYCRSRLGDANAAEDVANTVFVRLLQSKPVLRTSFVGQLLGTARNLCASELAAQRRIRTPEPERRDITGADPSREMEKRDTHAALADCLDRLPESDQTLVLLRHGEGLSHRQITDALGLRVAFSTLTRRLRAIVAKLRRCLKEKNIF